jgi:coproporphyrinogen III oxidase-like Fe-S oxidoreductase
VDFDLRLEVRLLLLPNTATTEARIEPYLETVKKELLMYARTNYVKTSVFDEIVLGGGTPSILSAEQMIDLIDFCKKHFNTNDEYFIKITGSSRSFDPKKIDKLAEYGVFQMDMGAQTFDNARAVIFLTQLNQLETRKNRRPLCF